MKNIFELIIPILGLSICIISAQIPAVSWNTYTPFHCFVSQAMLPTDNTATGTPFASESAGPPITEKLEMTYIHRELSQIRIAIAQLASRSDLYVTNTAVTKILTNLEKLTQSFASAIPTVVDIGRIPESCRDLQLIGHKMNGIYQIKGPKQIENVYCDFSTNATDLQKWIGYADVKSSPVHFYAETSSLSNITRSPISFDLVPVNVGNAMNLTSGIFTAPRSGAYFFSFAGLSSIYIQQSPLLINKRVGLYLNGVRMGKGGGTEVQNTDDNLWSPLTLNLKSGDQVWLENMDYNSTYYYYYYEYNDLNYYHFTGFMLEEDIVASL